MLESERTGILYHLFNFYLATTVLRALLLFYVATKLPIAAVNLAPDPPTVILQLRAVKWLPRTRAELLKQLVKTDSLMSNVLIWLELKVVPTLGQAVHLEQSKETLHRLVLVPTVLVAAESRVILTAVLLTLVKLAQFPLPPINRLIVLIQQVLEKPQALPCLLAIANAVTITLILLPLNNGLCAPVAIGINLTVLVLFKTLLVTPPVTLTLKFLTLPALAPSNLKPGILLPMLIPNMFVLPTALVAIRLEVLAVELVVELVALAVLSL